MEYIYSSGKLGRIKAAIKAEIPHMILVLRLFQKDILSILRILSVRFPYFSKKYHNADLRPQPKIK